MLRLDKAGNVIRGIIVCGIILLTGCGGGGGGNAVDASMTYSDIASETPPAGPQVDLYAAGYLPLVNGSSWTYSIQDANGNDLGTFERSISQLPSEGTTEVFALTSKEGNSTRTSRYLKTDDGLYFDNSNSSEFPPGAAQKIGLIREFAIPTYAPGEKRTVVRESTWDYDIDGDGVYERFRYEYSQVYDGLVTLSLPWDAQAETAKFTETYRLAVTTSKEPKQVYGYIVTQEEYYAKNIGVVRIVTRGDDLDGSVLWPATTYAVKTALVNNVQYAASSAPPSSSQLASVEINLVHNELIYDAARNLFYASIPSSVIGVGNSIAAVNPQTGIITYSQPVGSEPKVMSMSPDGQYLYVGLNGASEVVKLALPGFTELARINLGADSFYGPYFANSIAVSPSDSNVIAVSLKAKGVSPSHRGVVLVNGTAIAPKKTQDHTGSNLVTFGATGNVLYGLNNETTEFGLREITVTADGLTENKVVATAGSFNVRNFEYKNGKINISSMVYSAADLSLAGSFKQYASICRPLVNAAKTACAPSFADSGLPQITVHDSNTFVTLSSQASPVSESYVRDLVPGASGTIAISYGLYSSEPASKFYLLSSTDF